VLDDYVQVTTRAFEEPYTDEIRALVRVCGDHFEQHGDPRGTLIALGEARYDVDGKRAHELQYEIDQHVLAHHEAELGPLAPFVRKPRTCVLEWRCGQLYGAWLDTRHLEITERSEAIDALMEAPATKTLRKLAIRVRQNADVDHALGLVRARSVVPPLEQLLVLREVRPRSLALSSLAFPQFDRLYLLAERDQIIPLALEHLVGRAVTLINRAEAPLDVHDRRLLGRALTYPDASVREAAFDKVAELGPHAAMFVDVLALLLRPGLLAPLPIIACLAKMGRAARRALPALLQIPGRTTHYDADTRRAAGKLIASLREP